jgi:hypothetical protein
MNKDNFDRDQDLWYTLQENENSVDNIWDKLPYVFIEKWFKITSAKIALGNRNDEYSEIVDEICKSCIAKEKVSIKQFKCVLNYATCYKKHSELKYKHKVGKVK